jgi:cytosine/adenosine deaminase-related metal-dependent hydrolase
VIGWARPVSLVNGRILTPDGIARSVRFSNRVLGFDEPPGRDDTVVDLDGSCVLPGLVNGHDHLELNHYGRLKRRDVYANAREWIDDLSPALATDPHIRANRAHTLADRLFIGGLKNLLAGTTTVAHHNPLYRQIAWHVPVRVVRRFGWAHSFGLEGLPVGANGERGGGVRAQYVATARDRPFVVHAGEGVDEAAVRELQRLDEIGCVRDNTLVVHGVAMTPGLWNAYVGREAGVIWCPASNVFLFGRTLPIRSLLDDGPQSAQHLCLGTDSRLTGSRDLLSELRAARSLAPLSTVELLRMTTDIPARMLRLETAGRLCVDGPADLIVLPAGRQQESSLEAVAGALLAAERCDLEMIVIGGRPLVGAHRFRAAFTSRHVTAHSVRIDDTPRLMGAKLARRLRRSGISEPGVALH